MNRITSRRVALFIGVMTATAVIVYLPLAGCRQRRAETAAERQRAAEQEAAARIAATNAIAEHAQFLARYTDTAFTKKPGTRSVALAVDFGDRKPDRVMTDALVQRFQADTVQLLPTFFKPPFIADGLFGSTFNGSDDLFKKLELAKSVDELLLARASIEYSTNGPDLQNVITATVRLDVADIPVAGNSKGRTWLLTAAGAGFSQMTALAAAEERLVKQVSGNTNMSL